MFGRFESIFQQDTVSEEMQSFSSIDYTHEPRLGEFLMSLGGKSFNNGLYRVMAANTQALASAFVAHAFPDFSSRVSSFAYDWLGRVFALDSVRREGGSPSVVMFEPGTGEVLEIPANLATFHDNELTDYTEEALAVSFYKQWLAAGGTAPKQDECVGYKKPLFLGGKDSIENLEISDLEVYWDLSAQLIRKTRGLPHGTRVGKVGLSE